MTSSFFSLRSLAVAGLALLATGQAMAQQNRGGQQAGRGGTNIGGGGLGGIGGGGGGGGGNINGQRQYPNSTMVGDAIITSDVETRRLIVVTDDATAENIQKVIAELDKPKPQVLINVVFVQVTHGDDLDFGAEATYSGKVAIKNSPVGTATTKFGLESALADSTHFGAFYELSGKHGLEVTLAALAKKNKTEILSRPSILTRSSQQATIVVGQQVPIINNSRVSDTTGAISNTYTQQDVGIILRVTPFITQQGLVEMIVSPEISSLSATTVPISPGVSIPVIDRRSADTVVVTPTDATIVIGGLISTQATRTESKVPLLGDIPLIGNAFKRTIKNDEKTELLIFLTPHVVNDPKELSGLATQERAKLDLTPKTFQQEDMKKYIGAP